MSLTKEDLEKMRDKEDIQALIQTLGENDPYLRSIAVNYLTEIGGTAAAKSLIESLWKESDPYVRRAIIDSFATDDRNKRLTIEDPSTIKLMLGYLRKSGGELFDAFSEIISSIENSSIIYSAFHSLRSYCPITQERCNKTFQESNEYFVAHPFTSDRMDDLRRAINAAVQEIFPDLRPYYANQEIRGDIYCKICLKIRSSKFGIYDISDTCSTCRKSNPNVTLELGLAYGLNKPTILIAKRGSQIINDLQRFDRIEYTSYVELERELRSKIRNV
ncbi:MAG: HEAT repeat domain-containing protein [Spirochaetota bacterium]